MRIPLPSHHNLRLFVSIMAMMTAFDGLAGQSSERDRLDAWDRSHQHGDESMLIAQSAAQKGMADDAKARRALQEQVDSVPPCLRELCIGGAIDKIKAYDWE